MEYKGFLGENKFRDLVELEDKGLGYLLGINEDVPLQVVEITKGFLFQVWGKRALLMIIDGHSGNPAYIFLSLPIVQNIAQFDLNFCGHQI